MNAKGSEGITLAGSMFGDGSVDLKLDNGARVFAEPYNPSIHSALRDGEALD